MEDVQTVVIERVNNKVDDNFFVGVTKAGEGGECQYHYLAVNSRITISAVRSEVLRTWLTGLRSVQVLIQHTPATSICEHKLTLVVRQHTVQIFELV